jgi:hypothetical protein
MQQNATLETAAARREWVFAFLTLDVVRAFYDLMGLDTAVEAGLQGALRDATLVTRRQIVDALVTGGPKPTLAAFCRYVEGSVGAAASEHLVWWLQHVFDAEAQTHRALDRWSRVLRHCQREGDGGWRQLAFPEPLSNEASSRFAAAVDVKEYHRRREYLEARPLSDWDLHMYASQTYDFDQDMEGAWPNPFTHVSGTIRAYQQSRFWAWVLRALDTGERIRLREGALAIAGAAGLASIKDLADPSTLDIGL